MLYQRMNNGFYTDIINSADEWAKIYAYRVADVTEDRNVNSIDANALLNITPTPYYESLPTTVSDSMATFDRYGGQTTGCDSSAGKGNVNA